MTKILNSKQNCLVIENWYLRFIWNLEFEITEYDLFPH